MAKTPSSQAGVPGSIPGSGTRFHMMQKQSAYHNKRSHMPKGRSKILLAETKTGHSQINKHFLKKGFI